MSAGLRCSSLVLQPIKPSKPPLTNPTLRRSPSTRCGSEHGRQGKSPRRRSYGTSRRSVIKKSLAQEQVVFTPPPARDPLVAIIGGGVSGLLCASTLNERGIRSTVFDTGVHGLGGRMATRMVAPQNLVFDHAAQFFTVSDSRFQKLVDKWLEGGLVCEWKGLLGELEAGGHFSPIEFSTPRYIGVEGMRPLADSLLRQNHMVNVVRPCWISKIEPFNGMWHLSEKDELHGQFDAIVIAHNGKCANRLLSSSGLPLLAKQMKRLELSAVWALLAAFKDPLPIPQSGAFTAFEAAFVKGVDSISWMANNTSKLFPLQNDMPQCWTFLSNAAYGRRNKVPQENIPNVTAEKVKHEMLEGVEIALGLSKGSLQQPFYTRAQLWGAALPTNSLGVPCIFDPHGRAGVCGDWLLGSSVEAAALSGMFLANHVFKWDEGLGGDRGGGRGASRWWHAGAVPVRCAYGGFPVSVSVGQQVADYFQSGGDRPDEFAIGLHETFEAVGGHDIGQFPGLRSEHQVLEARACTTTT